MEQVENKNESFGKIIDMRLPLPWLLASVISIVFSIGGVFVKLNTVSESLVKMEIKTDLRDSKIINLAEMLIEQKGKNEMQDEQIKRTQADIGELKDSISDVRKSTRTQ